MDNINFQTPEWVCNIMAEIVKGTPKTILEPTKGAGNLLKVLHTRFPETTIHAPDKYEDYDKGKVDYIIANPPFTPMTTGYKMLESFFEISDNIIILMPWLALINSEKRTKLYMESGLNEIIHLPRKAFNGSRVQTCILVFEHGYDGDVNFNYVTTPNPYTR